MTTIKSRSQRMYPEEKMAYPTTQTHFPLVFIPAPLQKE